MTTTNTVILAGGCFWGMEDLFRKLPGVVDTEVGYAGGALENPTYKDVKTGRTGHAEAIRVRYDPAVVSYRRLLEFFFQIHDPTTVDRQGNDIGTQYRSAIFYATADEREEAARIIGEIDASKRWPGKVATRLEPAGPFTPAEDDHQDYLEKFPQGYTCHFVRPDWRLKDSA